MASKLPKADDLRAQDAPHLTETLQETVKSLFDIREDVRRFAGAITPPTGVTTLVRNVGLLAVAAVATGPLASGQPRSGTLTLRQTAVWIVAVVTALVVTHRGPAVPSPRPQRSE